MRILRRSKNNRDLIFQCASVFNKVGPALKADYGEVENFCRLYPRYGGGVIRYEDISIKEDYIFNADQSFFEMFSYPLISGDRRTALKAPNTAVVEEKTGQKYFGSQSPIGKWIRFGNNEEYEITGVLQSPENSHLKIHFLFSYTTYPKFWPILTNPPTASSMFRKPSTSTAFRFNTMLELSAVNCGE